MTKRNIESCLRHNGKKFVDANRQIGDFIADICLLGNDALECKYCSKVEDGQKIYYLCMYEAMESFYESFYES
jgi:hypothetical protein